MGNELGNNIAKCVIEEFNRLNLKSGKPVTRSNGIKEWTVLASVVALVEEEIIPITLSTGVKALPDKTRTYSHGLMVHDMHAEILSLRLFNWYLLDECTKLRSNPSDKSSILLESEGDYFKLKPGIKLALFISEPPCGDGSMQYLSSTLEDNKPWEDVPNEPPKKIQKQDVHRGRSNFDKLGIVRTKPGRSDSLITLSKSCSDKLCLRQLIGITNAVTSSLFKEEIYLDYIVVKGMHSEDFQRCFISRFKLPGAHHLKLIEYDSDEYEYHKPNAGQNMVPAPLSLLCVLPTKMVQVLNNGVKNGSFVKNKPPRAGGESIICKRSLVGKLKELKSLECKDYNELKSSNKKRESLKTIGKETLSNWVSTSSDNFEIL